MNGEKDRAVLLETFALALGELMTDAELRGGGKLPGRLNHHYHFSLVFISPIPLPTRYNHLPNFHLPRAVTTAKRRRE